jgi:hypothetical protein
MLGSDKGERPGATVRPMVRMRIVVERMEEMPFIAYLPNVNTMVYVVRLGHEDSDFARLRQLVYSNKFLTGFSGSRKNIQKPLTKTDALSSR